MWRDDGLMESTIKNQRCWIERFLKYCLRRERPAEQLLTRREVDQFARRYAHGRGIDVRHARRGARISLCAWSRELASSGLTLPPWEEPAARVSLSPLLAAFVRHRVEHRGVKATTIKNNLRDVRVFLAQLRRRHWRLSGLRAEELDTVVAELGERYTRSSVARICDSIRGFLRFTHATGRVRHDLATVLVAPIRADEKPPRSVPWADVRRILRAVDQGTRAGRRDYAILLLMASSGLGASEIVGLRLDDIDWAAATVRVRRRKTGQEIVLPLLPPVGKALAAYLRNGRQRRAAGRQVFIRLQHPYVGFTSHTAICRIVRAYARAAGVATSLGSHALRHSHATCHVDQGASLKVVGDILGHRHPASTSVYVRVALRRLRRLALPVPR